MSTTASAAVHIRKTIPSNSRNHDKWAQVSPTME